MLKLLRIVFATVLVGLGLCGLLYVVVFAIGLANTGLGHPGITEYVILLVFALPLLLICVGLILWGRRLYRDR